MLAVVLFLFACLTVLGIGESAAVAFVLFVMHLITLTVISAVGITTLITEGPVILKQNWALPPIRSVPTDIFFGFCAGLLGVSGFESSSNYIEEQAEGVFPKTLRNMTVIVSIFNPLLAFLAISLMPISFASETSQQLLILGQIAKVSVGYWLEVVVSVDAILVLSGAVLTSYVGVNGLVRRMALDRCLPQFLLHENKLRGTNHWIVLIFFFLTSSLILIVWGNPETLNGVYTVAFLSVLALFAIGNLLLKFKRARLPRIYNSPVPIVIIGLSLVVSALIGNIVYNPIILEYFSIYFAATLLIVITMLTRTRILKWLHRSPLKKLLGQQLVNAVKTINQQEMIFFTKTDELSVLNKAILYVRDNELTDRLRIVHVYSTEDAIPPRLRENVKILDEMYPKHRIDLGLVQGTFNPALVEKLAEVFNVPKNFMYITTPSDRFPHRISEFGGVRLITH
jgi:amino acid transporter